MADRTIDEATPDTDITGVEKIPMSDGQAAKYATTENLKNYIVRQIEAISATGEISIGGDKVYILRDGAIKPVDAAYLAAAVLDYGFNLAPVANINGNEIVGVKDSAVKKTLSVSALRDWLEDNMEVDAEIDWEHLTTAGTLGENDLFIISQSANDRKLTVGTYAGYVHGKFAAYLASLTSVQTVGTYDVVYIVQGGVAKKATVSQLIAAVGAGDTIAPSTTTEGKVPRWGSAQKTLTDGVEITTTVSPSPSGTKLPTESAVRTAIDAMGDVKAPGSTTQGNIPVWSATNKTLANGKAVVTALGDSPDDTQIPTAKAVKDAISAASGVKGPVSTVQNNIPQWDTTNKTLKNGLAVQTTVRDNASNGAIATELAVRNAINAIPPGGGGGLLYGGNITVTTNGMTVNVPDGKVTSIYADENISSFVINLPAALSAKPRNLRLVIMTENPVGVTVGFASGDDTYFYSDGKSSLSEFFTGPQTSIFSVFDFFFDPDGNIADVGVKHELTKDMSETQGE